MVLSQDGIFSRAEKATDKYGQAKARETLELALSDAQMKKYESGLTETELDNKIAEVGSLLPKEDENSNYQLVIVDGYIFEIDRSVPKIIDYKGPANGVIITARTTQNADWQNPVATVTGTITKYGGGSVVSTTVTATNNVTIPANFPTTGGSYTISNITTDTDITITTTDSDGKTATKTIHVVLIRDNTPPVISDQEADATLMKIKISAKATDSESGLASLTYKIEPNTIKDSKATGTLTSGTPIEVEATTEGDYTITFTATDNANNTSTAIAGPVTTIDGITISDAKALIKDESSYQEYLGKKVIDYKPTAGGIWRVFYYDGAGKFGDGAGTIYLKRDYDTTRILIDYYTMSSATENGLAMMKKINPDWANKDGVADLGNEKAAAGLCDTNNWKPYCDTEEAKYAIGAAPIEMWTAAYNAYLQKYEPSKVPSKLVNCEIQNENGYEWRLNGETLGNSQSISIDTSIEKSKVIATEYGQWLASPSPYLDKSFLCTVYSSGVGANRAASEYGFCPVVSLNH